MIKIIFSDMDGTLLDENGQLPPDFDEVMAELKKRNVIFAPASGRQYYALLRQLDKYKDDFMFLAENGTYGAYKGKEIFSNVIDKTEYLRVLQQLLTLGDIYPVVCGKKCSYILERWREHIAELDAFYTVSQYVDSYEEIHDDFIKLAVADCVGQDADKNIYQPMLNFPTKLAITLSSNVWVDFMNPEANKGWAVKNVQRIMYFKPEECAAFGDYLNDYEMMQSVYYSYAMANAHPKLKEVARFEAPSHKEYGVMQQIRAFIDQGLI